MMNEDTWLWRSPLLFGRSSHGAPSVGRLRDNDVPPLTHWGWGKIAAILQTIFFNQFCCVLIKTWLQYVLNGSIINMPSRGKIIAWRRWGDKPFITLTIGSQIYWRIYASLGIHQLTQGARTKFLSFCTWHLPIHVPVRTIIDVFCKSTEFWSWGYVW